MTELTNLAHSEKVGDYIEHENLSSSMNHLSKGLTSPDQDVFRTPTIEDYFLHVRQNKQGRDQGKRPTNSSTVQSPSSALLGSQELNPSNVAPETPRPGTLGWRDRIRHFTWTFFSMTMATGGIANVLFTVPFRFRGLTTLGTIFFLLNMVLFIINITLISLRFYYHPETFKASFLHPTERLFMPSAVVSFGTILINISQYGLPQTGPWLSTAVLVTFWIDVALAILSSTGIYLLMWSTKAFMISAMTPIWIFPVYPLLIIGPHAGILSSKLDERHAFEVIVGGFTVQGIGFLVSMMIYASYIYRLMTQKLPQESMRPGMFVSVGPSAFTAAGILSMAENISRALPKDFMGDSRLVGTILRVVASWMSLWIWGLAYWFFFVSIGAHWSCVRNDRMTFDMSWYSFIFPNTALITATFAVGKAFGSRAIQIIGCVLTPILILAWVFVFSMMIRAIILEHILWPQKGEDKDEIGYKGPKSGRRSKTTTD